MADCERQDWNPDDYYSYDDPCTLALGFDPSVYFVDFHDGLTPLRTHSLADAVFWPGRSGVSWAFAIDHYCPGRELSAQCDLDDRRLIARAVIWKRDTDLPSGWEWQPPSSKADAQRILSEAANWLEADLRSCPGAVEKLLALEKVRWMAFDAADRGWITTGKLQTEELVVVADGETVITRAGGMTDTTVSLDKAWPDGPGEWAVEMMELMQPCLKPTASTPPWAR